MGDEWGWMESTALTEAQQEGLLLRFRRSAMATTFEVALPAGHHPDPWAAAEAALDRIDALEAQLTVYRDDSEVSRVNATAACTAVYVEAGLFRLLERCAAWGRASDGAFDVACGAMIKAWGFYRRAGRVPSARERIAAMHASGMRHVVLESTQQSVRFRRQGLELNFGAVGKGYALDEAAALLRQQWGITQALLHGGGSSVLAVGAPSTCLRGWPIRLRHPYEPRRSLGTVYLRDAALGVSAATFQYFEYRGQRLGHLLDPRRGWPARGSACAAVIAPNAAQADALSTAAFVLGVQGAERLTRLYPDLTILILPEQPDGQTPVNPVVFQGSQRPTHEYLPPSAGRPDNFEL
ncbi:MAG: FAD:protein FMN transferase [Gemmataceae bacterium]|nr:FAD:protein FMN transferase [Gemmataceae bacterium]